MLAAVCVAPKVGAHSRLFADGSTPMILSRRPVGALDGVHPDAAEADDDDGLAGSDVAALTAEPHPW